MADLVRRLVSGKKARFKDKQLDLELDLVYVTDNIIIMGFPATGVEGLYRNRREDARKFLDHRHKDNYWIFNFCPLRENSYPPAYFYGRVSRYPFPDHHAPPLAILALASREIHDWLSKSPAHVAVLHCKAGKGRSGTLACAYLLTMDDFPSPPKLQHNLSAKDWADRRADEIMDSVETEDMSESSLDDEEGHIRIEKLPSPHVVLAETSSSSTKSNEVNDKQLGSKAQSETSAKAPPDRSDIIEGSPKTPSHASKLESVLALHTSRRMKRPSSPDKKQSQGVSIPSQRRFLHYWSSLLAGQGPPDFWANARRVPRNKVRLRQITVKMRELSSVTKNLLKLASSIAEATNTKYSDIEHGKGQVWISLARYNDGFVETLEKWEKHTRSLDGNLGRRRPGSDLLDGAKLADLFEDGKWDKSKMVRSFSRLGLVDEKPHKEKTNEGTIIVHDLKPLSNRKWETIKREITQAEEKDATNDHSLGVGASPPSTASSVTDLAQTVDDNDEEGIILDADREVRAKLYIGQVFLGWFWFIPSFHLPRPPLKSEPGEPQPVHFLLYKKDLDFPIGAGSAIVSVDVTMEWIPLSDPTATVKRPAKTQTSLDSARGVGGEPIVDVASVLQTLVGGEASTVDAVEAGRQ